MDGDPRYAWPTDGAFHRGYVDGLQGRAKRARQGEEYEDGYAITLLFHFHQEAL